MVPLQVPTLTVQSFFMAVLVCLFFGAFSYAHCFHGFYASTLPRFHCSSMTTAPLLLPSLPSFLLLLLPLMQPGRHSYIYFTRIFGSIDITLEEIQPGYRS
jgi:hypothetical protein